MISVVTIVKDNLSGFQSTFSSLMSQDCIDLELIVVDASSTDEISLFISSIPQDFPLTYYNEGDSGIYDALNIGVSLSKYQYILCLNSGDILFDSSCVSRIIYHIKRTNSDAVFFDWSDFKGNLFSFSNVPLRFNHQSVVYRKNLHLRFGMYITSPFFSTADYFFFKQVVNSCRVTHVKEILSRIDSFGISSGSHTLPQVFSINYLFGSTSRVSLFVILFFYPLYYYLKRFFKSLL